MNALREITNRATGRLDRRRALRVGGGLAGATALATLAGPGGTAAQTTLELDMACDGRTFRLNRTNQTGEIGLPVVGDTFIVYGSVYPAGSFDHGVAGPDDPGAIGRWICRGTFLIDIESGAVPHVVTTVLFALADGLSATNGLVGEATDGLLTQGLEGGLEETRIVLGGGYGRHAGARGEVVQVLRGENETLIELAPDVSVSAPNYTFQFSFTGE
jgi:hypothetical protein